MLSLIRLLFLTIFSLFRPRRSIIVENIALKKQLEIKNRKYTDIRRQLFNVDRLILVILNITGNIKEKLVIIKPDTVLKWQRTLIKKFWTFDRKGRPGGPRVKSEIRQLILSIKNDNLLWGWS